MTGGAAFAVAAAGGTACTWAARALARRWGIMSHPSPIVAQHTRPVAYLGGLGLAGGVAIALAVGAALRPGARLLPAEAPAGAIAAGALLFLVLGLADDLRPFSPGPKMMLQAVIASGMVAAGLAWRGTGAPAVDAAVSVFWITFLVNSVNMSDNCDGLVSAASVAVFTTLGITTPGLGTAPFLVAGAALGVLAFNRPPASIFLGDAGSHLLGFLLAAATLAGAAGQGPWPGVPWALLVAGVFLFDTVFTTAQRLRKGLPWWRGSPDHVSMRMLAAGCSRATVDVAVAVTGALLVLCAAALERLSPAAGAALLAGVVAALGIAWRALARWEVPPRSHPLPGEPAPAAGAEPA